MARKQHDRGMLQAIVASSLVKFKVNKNSKPETKTKAIEAAAKALGDKDPARARQITNWMFRHNYKMADIAHRLKETAKASPARKTTSARRSTKKSSQAEETQAAA